jgi:hypothetical protein
MKRFILGLSGLGICVLCFVAGNYASKREVEALVTPAVAEDTDVRVVKNSDGSRDVYIRSGNGFITRHRFGTDATLFSRSAYRVDEAGNPMTCRIYDPDGKEAAKVLYGYRRNNGKLAEERVFNSRTKVVDQTGKEVPMYRMIYQEDGEKLSFYLDEEKPVIDIAQRLDSPFRNPFVN